MADIKTILRELSVILGYILSKYKLTFTENFIDVKTYLDFIRKYCKNISECNLEVQKIEELDSLIIHKDIIENGLKLGKLLFEKLKLDGDIVWLGAKVKSKYPFDIKIGETGISLKEDSQILNNPSFTNCLNALFQSEIPFKNIHLFSKYAPKIKYAVLDDVEQTVVVIEDGSISTAHFNDEFIVINWYSNKIPLHFNNDNIDETIWKYLDEGIRYWKELHSKQEVDNEVILNMLHSVYGEVEFEKDFEFECFCEADIKGFLTKNNYTYEKN